LVFAVLGHQALPVQIAARIVLIPLIAGVAYEIIRFTGRQSAAPAIRVLLLPGLALQALTTREPDDDQIEVAIAALERAIALDVAETAGAVGGGTSTSTSITGGTPAAAQPAVDG
jgi:uncharacterized protein YqhQ